MQGMRCLVWKERVWKESLECGMEAEWSFGMVICEWITVVRGLVMGWDTAGGSYAEN